MGAEGEARGARSSVVMRGPVCPGHARRVSLQAQIVRPEVSGPAAELTWPPPDSGDDCPAVPSRGHVRPHFSRRCHDGRARVCTRRRRDLHFLGRLAIWHRGSRELELRQLRHGKQTGGGTTLSSLSFSSTASRAAPSPQRALPLLEWTVSRGRARCSRSPARRVNSERHEGHHHSALGPVARGVLARTFHDWVRARRAADWCEHRCGRHD